ncbi:hypothetical protein IV203_020964 [Nitzschia inconspicua]|uniref:Uncharacterized protein n=1 Tax=Nitzschia inconspicua TaxID=303405 RepID=A0A9K3PFJ5_9STRA|nr:hypothetical protein IV203_020964 [Nitzschia inconspicua]
MATLDDWTFLQVDSLSVLVHQDIKSLRREDLNMTKTPSISPQSQQNLPRATTTTEVDKRMSCDATLLRSDSSISNMKNTKSVGNRLNVDPHCKTQQVQDFCTSPANNIPNCMDHQAEAPYNYNITDPNNLNVSMYQDKDNDCKTLWFAGFHEGENACPDTGISYAANYAAALTSALKHAGDALQPVLMLGRDGLPNQHSPELSRTGQWAQDRGARVIVVPHLSFQDQVNVTTDNNGRQKQNIAAMGPFLRLDIPMIIDKYNLFDRPGICQKYILYTDTDVIFPNRITRGDVAALKQDLKASHGEAIISYGRESGMEARSFSTGVMILDVPNFQKEWPSILEFAKSRDKFPAHDQILLNHYFTQSEEMKKKRKILSLYWIWKTYWKLEPSTHDQVKVIHFHGPKLQKGLEEMARCEIENWDQNILPGYQRLFKHGICCDQGKTAKWAVDLSHWFQETRQDICEEVERDKLEIPVTAAVTGNDQNGTRMKRLSFNDSAGDSAEPRLPLHPHCISNEREISKLCSTKPNQECMSHHPEAPPLPKGPVQNDFIESSPCRTLWFASFHEGPAACPLIQNGGAGYAMDYSAALNSAIANARTVLQPVLLLGRYGLHNENSTELSKVGKWAKQHGAEVIVVPRLSFQDDIDLREYNFPKEHFIQASMGPFMRLDIPHVILKFKLFDNQEIVQSTSSTQILTLYLPIKSRLMTSITSRTS